MDLTQDDLKDILHYDPSTGLFTWLVANSSKRKVGDVAGNINTHGYVQIMHQGRNYTGHRLAWLFHYGEWPNKNIDHINRVRHDNRLENLRLATTSQNMANARISKRNTSGYKGVSLSGWREGLRCKKRYEAYVSIGGKKKSLGVYETAEEAHQAYVREATKMYGEYHYAGY